MNCAKSNLIISSIRPFSSKRLNHIHSLAVNQSINYCKTYFIFIAEHHHSALRSVEGWPFAGSSSDVLRHIGESKRYSEARIMRFAIFLNCLRLSLSAWGLAGEAEANNNKKTKKRRKGNNKTKKPDASRQCSEGLILQNRREGKSGDNGEAVIAFISSPSQTPERSLRLAFSVDSEYRFNGTLMYEFVLLVRFDKNETV